MLISLRWLVVCGVFLTHCYGSKAQNQDSSGSNVTSYVEQMPEFPGGQAALSQTLGQLTNYPTEALQQRLEGRVFVQFVIAASGRVQDARVSKPGYASLDAEAVRAVSSLPAFTPGKRNGQPAAVAYTVPITFKLPANVEQILANRATRKTGNVTTEYARFPGGPEALATYLASVSYPEAARASKAEGRVFVNFEISPEGKVGNVAAILPSVEVKRRKASPAGAGVTLPDPLLVKAAEQLVAAMPDWQPAAPRGMPIMSTQTVPVDFTLTPTSSTPVYAYADQMPVFLGVTNQIPLQGNIQRAIRYPVDALRNGKQGQVLVYFVVNEQGQIDQVDIIRPVYPAIDAEVVRAVRAQKVTTPAMQQGKPVKVYYVLPLNFAIR